MTAPPVDEPNEGRTTERQGAWQRVIGTTVSVAALVLVCAAAVTTLALRRRCAPRRRRKTAAAVTVLLLGTAVLPIDSLVGDARDALRPSRPALTFVAGEGHDRTFILFPTIILDASQTFAAQIQTLRAYGDVVLVDYADGRYDGRRLNRSLLELLARRSLRDPYLVGASFGVVAAIDFLRFYDAAGRPAGQVIGLMAISGPADGNDVRADVPIDLAHAINGGPILQWLWSSLYDTGVEMQRQIHPLDKSRLGTQPGVLRNQVVAAYHGMRSTDVRSLLSRLQALSRSRSVRVGEFPHVPATVLWVGHPDGDYLIKSQALRKLQRAFPDHHVRAELPGIHADLIGWGPSYTEVIEEELRDRFGEDLIA